MKQITKNREDKISCSVIIRTKNRPRHLYRSLDSIRCQHRKPDEVVVVNDGGESIESVLEVFSDLPLISIVNSISKGRAKAGNTGATASKSKAICFLDDDDRFYPDHLKRLELCMLKFDAKVAYSGSILVLKDLLGEINPEQKQIIGEFNDPFDSSRLAFENYIPLNTLLIDRELFLNTGKFDSSFELFEDWDLLLRLSKVTKFYHLDMKTSEYAVWGKSNQITLSSRSEDWRNAYDRIFRKHFLPLEKSNQTKLMADYWMMSQKRRSRIQELEKTLQSSQATLQSSQATLQSSQAQFTEQLNSIKSSFIRQKKQNQRLKQVVHEQNKQLTLGLGCNDIKSLLSLQTNQVENISSNVFKSNYDRLVNWLKSHEMRITEDVENFSKFWNTLEKKMAELEINTASLLDQLHASKLRKVWGGIPIPQVTSLLKKNKEIHAFIANTTNGVIPYGTSLLLPPQNQSLDQESLHAIVEYTPIFEAFAGSEEKYKMIAQLNGLEPYPIVLEKNKKLCFNIYCNQHNFFCVKIMLATYLRINTCNIKILIFEEEKEAQHSITPLRICEFNAINALDNQYYKIMFQPIINSRGKVYRFEINSPNATEEQHIAVWCQPTTTNEFVDPPSFFDTCTVMNPWTQRMLSEIPCKNFLCIDSKKADHIFWIYNTPHVNSLTTLSLTMFQLAEIAGNMKRSLSIFMYGQHDPAIQNYCKKNGISYLTMEESIIDKNQILLWVLQQANDSKTVALNWFIQNGLCFEKNIIQNAESFFEAHQNAGMLIPVVKNHKQKISHAFGQITNNGEISTFSTGIKVNHPTIGYIRDIDAADAPFFIMPASVLKNLTTATIDSYHTVRYQITELIWQLKTNSMVTKFEPGVAFIGDKFQEHTNKSRLNQDQMIFFKKWRAQLLDKPSIFDDMTALLNPDKLKTALIVDMTLPTFDEDSGSLRMFELIRLLTQLRIKVTFFPDNMDSTIKYRRALEQIGVEVFCGNYGISDAFAECQYDIIILSRVEIGYRYMNMAKLLNPDARIYYDTVDIHYLRELRRAEIEQNKELRQLAGKTRQKELSNCIQADVVFTVTKEDKKHLRKEIPSLDCVVVPNIHGDVTSDISWQNTDGLVFIGNYHHTPNVDAVLYFVKNVFPLILKKIPEIKLYLIGSNMKDSIKALESENIQILGWVEKVEPELVKRRVCISYLRYGAGMKGKIGQAMALGLPVVSTSIGAEGMELKDEETVLVADDPRSFANNVCRAYTDKKLWMKISENGKKDICKRYGTEAVKEKLKAFLEKDINKKF
ncbi:MAG: hypothetical protein B6I31_04105 [Desulfobacteraceae bacterium 4572_19]|nr:MAG: hypothetical protein B6I31_04105 [Desulfobacteraceae bacterium 4572_19]